MLFALKWIQRMDETVLRWIAEHLRRPFLDGIMLCYTFLGNAGWIFILLSLLLLLKKKTRCAGTSALTAMSLGLIVTNLLLKPIVGRARPWMVMEDFVSLTTSSDLCSFPSGHTCAAFAWAVALCLSTKRNSVRAIALIGAVLMGFSRLYVGVHFPSDVMVGAIIGAMCGIVGAGIVRRVKLRLG